MGALLIQGYNLQGDFNTNSAWKVTELTCVPSTGMRRPEMNEVLTNLKECLGIEVDPRSIQSSVATASIGSVIFLENKFA